MSEPVEILAADVGNTHATVAHLRGREVLRVVEMDSHAQDAQVAEALRPLADALRLPLVIGSVNPEGRKALIAAWKLVGKGECLLLGRELGIPIENRTKAPEQVGQDRLLNSLAACEHSDGNAIVVDFGTAITFDVVQGGAYCGGVITPGIGLALEALHQKTALLPLVRAHGKPPVLGRDTEGAINSGVFYGYVGLVTNILRELSGEYETTPRVLSTGGYGSHIAPYIPQIDESLPNLTHEGIALCYERRQGASPVDADAE